MSSWPVKRSECRKFIPAFALFFLISLVYNLLRSLKISLVIAAPSSGAEIIPYLKIWGVLPGAFCLTYLFTLLNRFFSKERVFVLMTALFLVFFSIFLFFIYPAKSQVELTFLADTLEVWLPSGFSGLIAMVRYWHLTLFYVFSELWSTVILSMLFWGYVNETTPYEQAQRLYGLFALGANLAPIVAGSIGLWLTRLPELLLPHQDSWDVAVYITIGFTLLCGVIILCLFYDLDHLNQKEQMFKASEASDFQKLSKKASEKLSFSLIQCFKEMIHSPYLRYLAIIVLSYNWIFNLTDVIWSDQIKTALHGSASELNAFISKVTILKGLLATFIALFASNYLLKHFGWRFTALITPYVLILLSFVMLPLIMFEEGSFALALCGLVSCPIAQLTLMIGSVQNALTRACKYTVFDATKEIAYIPLSSLEKRKGKAVIDGIGSRIGKSAGSITFQVLLPFYGSIVASLPFISWMMILVSFLWVISIYRLDALMKERLISEK